MTGRERNQKVVVLGGRGAANNNPSQGVVSEMTIDCAENHNFPQPKVTSSDRFCQRAKFINASMTTRHDEENHQIPRFNGAEPPNVLHFCLKNDSNDDSTDRSVSGRRTRGVCVGCTEPSPSARRELQSITTVAKQQKTMEMGRIKLHTHTDRYHV